MNKTAVRLSAGALVLLMGLFIAQAYLLLSGYRQMLGEAQEQEVRAAQGLVGALLQSHPELEQEIAAALQPSSLTQHQAAGRAVLSRYGFDIRETLQSEHCRSLMVGWRTRLLLFTATAAALFCILLLLFRARRKGFSGRMEEVLEQYLAENYAFATSLDALEGKRPRWGGDRPGDLLKQLGNSIRLKNLRLTQERENTKSLVTDISHQIKTPIASLKLCVALVLEADNAQERGEFLERSRQQIEKLEGMTAALMNISRMETSMIELRLAPLRLQELLLRAANAVYDKARAKNITLELEPCRDIALCLDERWTAEAIVNLLDNSIKYSPAGSHIEIRAEELVSFVRITIADEGIGIPRGERSHIFQRFYRGAHPAVKAGEGAGVGLYLTRMILERQGGGVSVGSRHDAGSVFVVQLPKPRPKPMDSDSGE